MPIPRRAVTVPSLGLALVLASACTTLLGAPGASTFDEDMLGSSDCPPTATFADPRSASYADVAAHVGRHAVAMATLDSAQWSEAPVMMANRLTGARARAVPSPCVHRYGRASLARGRLLGLVTADAPYPLFGLDGADTAYVWMLRAPTPGRNVAAGVLVNLRQSTPTLWTVVDIDYHPEGQAWWSALADFVVIQGLPHSAHSSRDARSLFRLASYGAPVAMGDTTASDGNTSAWFTCMTGCCRVKPTTR